MSNINSTKECERKAWRRSTSARVALTALTALSFAATPHSASADAVSRAQAKRMYDRLTGTPPSPTLLNTLEPMVASDPVNAALYMLDPNLAHSSDFYRVTLKNFAPPWTNRDRNVFAPLNDY